MRKTWMGAVVGLAVSPVAIGVATLLRYVWPGFPLLGVLHFFASLVASPLAVLTGQPVVLDAAGAVSHGQLTLMLAYGLVLVSWCSIGGLVVGAVLEQSGGAPEGPAAP